MSLIELTRKLLKGAHLSEAPQPAVATLPDSQARLTAPDFHTHKQAAVESFLGFTAGGEAPQWPLEVFLEISNICDLQCAMCPTFSALNPNRFKILKNNDRGLISFEETAQPLESVLEHALIVHAFGYGEPTIHPQFREFIAYLAGFNVMVDFFTHGMHLTQELCEFLVANRVARLTISFSGATAQEYENVYLGGDFDRVLTGLKTLSAVKAREQSSYPAIDVNSLGFTHHVEKLPEFVRLMGEHGVSTIHLKPLQTYDTIKELHTHSSVMRPAVEGPILEEAKRVAAEYQINLASVPYEQTQDIAQRFPDNPQQARHKGDETLSAQAIDIKDLKTIARSQDKKTAMRIAAQDIEDELARKEKSAERPYIRNTGTPCLEPYKTLYASFNGKVYPCCFKNDSGEELGTLHDNSAEEVWRGAQWQALRTNALQREYPEDLCGNCLKANTYPKSHNLAMKLNQYSRWFAESFGCDFDQPLLQRARQTPDNEAIIAQRTGQSTPSSPDGASPSRD
tara:strand:+ start:58192 stop:59724 length:1533 start_codon:yes stop_codon:yes gene_type:complete